jgi:hypothetical protein
VGQKRFLSSPSTDHTYNQRRWCQLSHPTKNVFQSTLSIWQYWFWTLTTVVREEPCCFLDGDLINASHSAAKNDYTTAINYAPNDDAKHITLSHILIFGLYNPQPLMLNQLNICVYVFVYKTKYNNYYL